MEIVQSLPRNSYKGFAFCALAYMLALLAAFGVGYAFRNLHPILMVLLADIAGTLVIYFFGRIFKNASFYDPYWSVAPIVIAFFWVFGFDSRGALPLRQIIVAVLVCAWGLRLTYNWVRGWQGIKHEDWRYRNFRENTGGWFWLVDLVGIELMPTVFVFLGCLSLYSSLAMGENHFNALDVIAFIVTLGAILIETISDEQLKEFQRESKESAGVMTKGLWAHSRHPNYFGEVAFWWGLFFFGLAADSSYWWTIIGPLAITVLFTMISIPMMEKRSRARRQGYKEITGKISPLVPWFSRKQNG